MSSNDPMPEKHLCGPKWRGVGMYFFLLSTQTAGSVLLMFNLIPLYRVMAMDFVHYTSEPRIWWAISGILLIQLGFWTRVRLGPPLPQRRNFVLGQIILFGARLSFVAVTAAFTEMFLKRYEMLKTINYPPLRALLVLMLFFSLFCWTFELERLAKALQGDKHESS